MIYPKQCYNEPGYKEVEVYFQMEIYEEKKVKKGRMEEEEEDSDEEGRFF